MGGERLKPCPFCGAPAKEQPVHHFQPQRMKDGSTREARSVQCSRMYLGCFGHGPIEDSAEKAVAAWNRRATPGTQGLDVDALADALIERLPIHEQWKPTILEVLRAALAGTTAGTREPGDG